MCLRKQVSVPGGTRCKVFSPKASRSIHFVQCFNFTRRGTIRFAGMESLTRTPASRPALFPWNTRLRHSPLAKLSKADALVIDFKSVHWLPYQNHCTDPCKKNHCGRQDEVCSARPGPRTGEFASPQGYACVGRGCQCFALWDPHCAEETGLFSTFITFFDFSNTIFCSQHHLHQ